MANCTYAKLHTNSEVAILNRCDGAIKENDFDYVAIVTSSKLMVGDRDSA